MKAFLKKHKTKILLIFTIIVLAILSKVLLFNFLGYKYYADSKTIVNFINSGTIIEDKSFGFTVKFFKLMNIFKFTTIYEWSIFLFIIFNLFMLLFLIKRKDKYSLIEYLFIICSIVLLNIYVFNISKDIIQFIIFGIIYLIFTNLKINLNIKAILTFIIFLLEGLFFREYYAIIGMLFIFLYLVYLFFTKKKLNKNIGIKLLGISIITLFFGIIIIRLISYNKYLDFINARYYVNFYESGREDTVTIINNLLGYGNSYFKFILNYLINFIRLNLPLELLFKGIKYIPFVIFQLFISFNIYKILKKVNKNNILIISLIISYLLVAIVFEPDFGSFIRHQSAFIIFYIEMILRNNLKFRRIL